MTNKTFLSATLPLVELYIYTVPRFKDEFRKQNYFTILRTSDRKINHYTYKFLPLKIDKFFVTKTQKLGFD